MTIAIRTERLTLRTVDGSAAPQVLEFVQRNKSFLREWEPARGPEFFTLKEQKEILLEDCEKMNNGTLFKVWFYKDRRIIGSASLSNIVRGNFLSCHLGYKMDAEECGKGYMTEALRALIDYAFDTLGLHRIEANIMPRNHASLKVAEKLGFHSEGLAKKYLKINGVWEDHIHMVLLNEKIE
ncbi:GNAT family N-acetyltransferase [Paenibacillus thermotolerans]|uniref:GNAT family N-acetyltransferase n=1 Tax=Paenibacillus thermotolerans TaxID=3027807 RepID=UPI0023688B79|nr:MULTISPECIES: GNAT family protein [unclassified Paenibacillus]